MNTLIIYHLYFYYLEECILFNLGRKGNLLYK